MMIIVGEFNNMENFSDIPVSEIIFSNPEVFVIYDRFPVSPGHVLIITHRVIESWFDATFEEQLAILDMINTLSVYLPETLENTPDGYNVGFNCGIAAGQTIPHLHVHMIPRYNGDMQDPRGGVRHVIPSKGNYLKNEY